MIRVLYLHGLRGSPSTPRRALLEEACHPNPVSVPNLKTRQTLALFTVGFVAFFLASGTVVVLAWLFLTALWAALISTTAVLVIWIGYVLAGRAVTHYMVVRATKIAEKAFWDFRPNVIVASSFGAIVVFGMNVPKVSLILLSPAQDAYCRYFHIGDLPTLAGYPYVIVIHGSNDDEISLDDSIRLVDCSAYVQCKLEVIEDTHALSTLTAGDFKEFIDEAYEKGRQQVLEMKKEMMRAPLKKTGPGKSVVTIDPTLFFVDDEEKVQVNKNLDIETAAKGDEVDGSRSGVTGNDAVSSSSGSLATDGDGLSPFTYEPERVEAK